MLDMAETRDSLRGAFRLAIGHKDGLRLFQPTIDAFFRSFLAAFLVLPLYLLHLYAERQLMVWPDGAERIDGTTYLFIKLAAFAVDWLSFPIAMIFLSRLLGLTQRYALYVTVFNWTSVLLSLLLFPPFILWSLGVIGAGLANFMSLILILLAVRIRWFMAVTVLAVPGLTAGGLVALEFILSLAIAELANQAIGIVG